MMTTAAETVVVDTVAVEETVIVVMKLLIGKLRFATEAQRH